MMEEMDQRILGHTLPARLRWSWTKFFQRNQIFKNMIFYIFKYSSFISRFYFFDCAKKTGEILKRNQQPP